MSDRDQSTEELLSELESLRREVVHLKSANAALDIQTQLLKNFVALANSSAGWLIMKATLQQTLEVAIKQTHAQQGSLFLLDDTGAITESILARGATTRDHRQELVGQVLDKGLAGWVAVNRQVGLIADTLHDNRWLKLPNEPYTVRSALGVPIVRGKALLGILTLMHPDPEHFSPEMARLMQGTAEAIAIVLDNARIYSERKRTEDELRTREERLRTIVANLPIAVWMLDPQGVFALCDGLGLQNLGLNPEDVVGESVFDLYRDTPQVLKPICRALAGETLNSILFKLDGAVYDSWFSPLKDDKGNVTSVLCAIADITSTVNLRHKSERRSHSSAE